MLESLVATILNRVLGSYVRNFDPNQLNISVWSGDIKLRDLALKKEALDQFHLPVNVVHGHLGELTIQIPWSNLKNKPVKITIDNVFILAVARQQDKIDPEEEAKRELAAKREKLEAAELMDQSNEDNPALSSDEIKRNQSFSESLTTKIIDNLQITIKNIHVRYEDVNQFTKQQFAMGVTLEELSAISTDQDWKPAFIQGGAIANKLARLGSLSMYWNSDTASLAPLDNEEFIKAFKALIAAESNALSDSHQYILRPVSGVGKVTMNKGAITKTTPKTKIELMFEELGFIFDSLQYRDVLFTASEFQLYYKTLKYRALKPKDAKHAKDNPREWFQYAIKAVLQEIHDKNKVWSWDYIKGRRDDRREYIKLYKQKLEGTLTDTTKFDKLEMKLSYEDLRFYRSLATKELKEEKPELFEKSAQPDEKKGWFSWMWGTADDKEKAEKPPVVLTDDQKKELYDTIGWDEEKSPNDTFDVPKDVTMMRLDASLKSGSLQLSRDQRNAKSGIAKVEFTDLFAAFSQRIDSFAGDIGVGDMFMDDSTVGSAFPRIVSGKQLAQMGTATAGNFLDLTFENNPLDGHADSCLSGKMKALNIIYNVKLVEQVILFFKPADNHQETLTALMSVAGTTVEEFQAKTRIGLEYALEEHKTIDVQLDLAAPLIVMPLDITNKESPCLLIDAGQIKIKSDLADKKLIDQVKSKASQQYSQADWDRLKVLMYDKFNIELFNTQLLIGSNMKDAVGDMLVEHSPNYVIDRINLKFLLEVSIVPDATHLSKIRVSGELPKFQASLSDARYKLLMKFIDLAIPNTDSSPSDTPSHDIFLRRSDSQYYSDINDNEEKEKEKEEKEASAIAKMSAPQLKQKQFEFFFKVDTCLLSLRKCTNWDTLEEEPLVDWTLGQFDVYVATTELNMYVDFNLAVFHVESFIESDTQPQFRKIISSHYDKANGEDKLLQVHFERHKRELEAGREPVVTEQIVTVYLSTISFVLSPKTYLTIMDFILTAFTDDEPALKHGSGKLIDSTAGESTNGKGANYKTPEDPPQEHTPTISVKVILNSIVIAFVDDGIKISTAKLSSANIKVLLVQERMLVEGQLGNLSVRDDMNEGTDKHSILRQLVSIEGEKELAQFSYETFSPSSDTEDQNYTSAVYFRSSSIKVNFVEEPFARIVQFLAKFSRMKAIYDVARQMAMNQVNQAATQTQPDKMKLDVIFQAPIIVFPTLCPGLGGVCDLITFNFGEFYLQNSFQPFDDSAGSTLFSNDIHMGIRNTSIASEFYTLDSGKKQSLEIIGDLQLKLDISYVEYTKNLNRPSTIVTGNITGSEMKLTELQFKYLMIISDTLQAVFSGDANGQVDDEEMDEFAADLMGEDAMSLANESVTTDSEADKEEAQDPNFVQMDVAFKTEAIALTLFADTVGCAEAEIDTTRLTKFSLNDIGIKFKLKQSGAIDSEFQIQSFTIDDCRPVKENKFTEILPKINNDEQQFQLRVSRGAREGKDEKPLALVLTIDSPQMILSLDFCFAMQAWFHAGMPVKNEDEEELEELMDEERTPEGELSENGGGAMVLANKPIRRGSDDLPSHHSSHEDRVEGGGEEHDGTDSLCSQPTQTVVKVPVSPEPMSINVVVIDASIIVLADNTVENTEALVIKTEQIVYSQSRVMSLTVSNAGVFLSRMETIHESRLRVLDDFSVVMSHDNKHTNATSMLTTIQISIEPLIMRLSIRDVMMVADIVSKATATQGQEEQKAVPRYSSFSKDFQRRLSRSVADTRTQITGGSRSRRRSSVASGAASGTTSAAGSIHEGMATIMGERCDVEFSGMRFVAMGVIHELPFLDFWINPFTVKARNWSSDLSVDTGIECLMNFYNYSKSSWEPLMEPWNVGFHLATQAKSQMVAMDIYSRKRMEVTITSRTLALVSKMKQMLNSEYADISNRKVEAPYRITNQTGFPIEVWTETDNTPKPTELQDGDTVPWSFQSTQEVRESLVIDTQKAYLSVRLMDSPFDVLHSISAVSEGEFLHVLKPRIAGVSHRLVVEITLNSDTIKEVLLKSAYTFTNHTQIEVDLGLDDEGKVLPEVFHIAPGESRAVPIDRLRTCSVLIRPAKGYGYGWCKPLEWTQFLEKPPVVACKRINAEDDTLFFFQATAKYDRNEPLTRVYPHMEIVLSPPVEIENLLPYDLQYRIYDKSTKKDWTNFIKRGGKSPVHVVELNHLLLLSVHPRDCGFERTDFAVINAPKGDEFDRENEFVTRHEDGQRLRLHLHYVSDNDSYAGIRVQVFTPYLLLNKTGLNVQVRSHFHTTHSKVSSQLPAFEEEEEDYVEEHGEDVMQRGHMKRAQPTMFSLDQDDRKARVTIKVGDSKWSDSQSFDAIGGTTEIIMANSSKQSEIHVGMHVFEGKGRYKLTRFIELTPRFIIHNCLKEELRIRDPMCNIEMSVGAFKPIHFMSETPLGDKVCLEASFTGEGCQWSAPFSISDIGKTYVKIYRAGKGFTLLNVDVILEQATIFLHFEEAGQNWPFSIRNFTEEDFTFFQANPFVNDDGEELDSHPKFKPLTYKLPGKSVMPYAWDYPASPVRELVLITRGKRRHIQLAEIGNLTPMKLPAEDDEPASVVDLNVVADGPTQTLVISPYDPDVSLYKLKGGQSSTSMASRAPAAVFELDESDKDIHRKFTLSLEGVGVSLINNKLQELCYITLRGLEVKYNESDLYETLSFQLKWVQVDNQLFGGIYPIVLYPSVVPMSGKELDNHPTFSASLCKVRDDSHGVIYIKYATLLLQEMTLEMDEDFLFSLLDFMKLPEASWTGQGKQEEQMCADMLEIPEPKPVNTGADLYFEMLHIQPAQMNLTFVRTERVNVDDKSDAENTLMFFLNVLTMAIGNINDAPVKLNALMMENVRTSWPVLIQAVSTHYGQGFFYQLHKILGSADFLGNPVGLFTNISSGIMDIFYEPYQGFIMNDRPSELGIGLAKGSLSFVKKSVYGVSDSISKVTGSISKGLSVVTMDKSFQNRRRVNKTRNRPKHALFGLTTGASSFFDAFASGIAGIAEAPMHGAATEGAAGFFKGVGKGLVGLPTKTAIGMFDFANNISEGIKNTTTVFDPNAISRIRATRYLSYDGIVRPYSQTEAVGQTWLKLIDGGTFFNDKYLAHVEIAGTEKAVILTFNRIIMFHTVNMESYWTVKLEKIDTITMEKTGLALKLLEDVPGPFIPIPDPSNRKFFYHKIAVAVQEFNIKHQTLLV
ncbi:hypothetical protein B0I73DRAFT_150485 [Yarrowia lipolytica]|nr:hypothetical protein B0I73DRAFT_150485 [Yarrowia lipolytica]